MVPGRTTSLDERSHLPKGTGEAPTLQRQFRREREREREGVSVSVIPGYHREKQFSLGVPHLYPWVRQIKTKKQSI